MNIEDAPVVIQEATRMASAGGISPELIKEDVQRACGASISEVSAAAAILCQAHGINPRGPLGDSLIRFARTSIICGARTAQRLNGNTVL